MPLKLWRTRILATACCFIPIIAFGPSASATDRFANVEIKALQKIGCGRPAMILNTHVHGDHTGGNPFFGETGGIIDQDNVRTRLLNQPQFPAAGLPKLTYKQQLQLHINGDSIRVVHLPQGHTDGDSVVLFQSANVVHVGDHFFNGAFPYIDINNGGSVSGFINNLRSLLSTLPQDVLTIPRHGPMGDLEDLQRAMETIKVTRSIIRSGIAGQLNDDQIAEQLTDYSRWGQGFISIARWISIIRADQQAFPSSS